MLTRTIDLQAVVEHGCRPLVALLVLLISDRNAYDTGVRISPDPFTGPTGIDQCRVLKKEIPDTGNKCRK
jgi:hypothetical protein